MSGKSIIVMGVSGSGKSSVGKTLAEQIGAKFIDGDDLHPRANIIKMASGHSLDDHDRKPWLERIGDAAYSLEHKNEIGIIVCSALKRQYRDLIRLGNQNVTFLFLRGEFDLIAQRLQERKGHYMPTTLLQSQFDTLEVPKSDEADIKPVDIDASFDEVVKRCLNALG